MEPLPYLLDPAALESAGPYRLLAESLRNFGQAPIRRWPDSVKCKEARESIRENAVDEWLRALALELLFDRYTGSAAGDASPTEACELTPFESCDLTLGELWRSDGAVALIPLRGAGGGGAMAQIWLVRQDKETTAAGRDEVADHRHRVRGLAEWLAVPERSTLKVYVRSTETYGTEDGIVGTSWMLGAALVERVLWNGDRDLRRRLGADWVVTGSVDGFGKVGPVEMAGKTELDLPRRWLLPAANEPDLPPRFRKTFAGRIGLVVDTESAWRHFAGTGTQRENPTEQWPRDEAVESLHGLVSPAIRPLIASVLYTRPKKFVLWHSAETLANAEVVRGTLIGLRDRGLLPEEFEVDDLREMDAADLVEAENDLRTKSNLTQVTDRPILFNITGGNMLMKYAVINLAALNPNLWLLYRREGSKESHDFIRLRTLGTQFAASPLNGSEEATDGVNWDFLFGFSREDSVDSLVEGIVRGG